jgi:hypothetical protein
MVVSPWPWPDAAHCGYSRVAGTVGGCVATLSSLPPHCFPCRRCFVGETHILLHGSDLMSSGSPLVVCTPAEALLEHEDGEVVPHIVRCARCEGPLGSALCNVGSSAIPESIRLHKDRLSVVSHDWTPSKAFVKYTVATRLFWDLLERASSHSQYRFLLHACDEVTGAAISTEAEDKEWVLLGLRGTGVRMKIILLNWNSAVVHCSGNVQDNVHDNLPEVSALKVAFEYFPEEPGDSTLK